jgi:large subunit ribosomal protein L35Ae
MNGVVVNYRSSKHRQTDNYMVVLPEGSDSKEKAKKLVGKTVVWASPAKKELKGRITNSHGNSGAVRVLFETGMPGQAIGRKVRIE